MLDSLRLEPAHRVWDVGTGQGRTAALSAWRACPMRWTGRNGEGLRPRLQRFPTVPGSQAFMENERRLTPRGWC
ncbi:hypothetical protein ACFWIQ_25140 [Kitasatospora sp. NPDC127059]|uniref:hypothetical protein n=1 Tax=unclassified Kitasatospora TaxID=2633591 RepID=UPI003656B687